MKTLQIYLLGVLCAFALITYAIRKNGEKHLFLFIPNERVQFLSLFSWIVVCGFVAAWLYDMITFIYVFLLFKYLLWKQKKRSQ